jgi:hypothetical protein
MWRWGVVQGCAPFVHISSVPADDVLVERRKQPRLKVRESVMLITLGTPGGHPIEACVVDMSSNGVQVRVPTQLPRETLVKIEGEHELILGQVCHCEPEGGAYRVGIRLTSPLPSLALELELLNRALIAEGLAEKVESPAESQEEKSPSAQSGKH